MDTNDLKFPVGTVVCVVGNFHRGRLGVVTSHGGLDPWPYKVNLSGAGDYPHSVGFEGRELEAIPQTSWCGICGTEVPEGHPCKVMFCPKTPQALQAAESIEDAFALPPAPEVATEASSTPTGFSEPPKAIRVEYLEKAISLTKGDRDEEYGDPLLNMACAGDFKAVLRRYLGTSQRPIGSAELEALDMMLTKVSRLACGHPKPDTYIDGAAYLAIAGECATRERNLKS